MPNRFVRSKRILDFFDGLLLGDGNYHCGSRFSAAFQLSQHGHDDWVYSINGYLNRYNIVTRINYRLPKRRLSKGNIINDHGSTYIRTLYYRTLLNEHNRWYKNGEKRIPKDINISNPLLLAQWYMGDGGVEIETGRYELKLFTNDFPERDVRWLIRQIKKHHGIHGIVSHWRGQPYIQLQHKNAAKFIGIVKPYIVDSFKYKIPDNPWKPPICVMCEKKMPDRTRLVKYCSNKCRNAGNYQNMKRRLKGASNDRL